MTDMLSHVGQSFPNLEEFVVHLCGSYRMVGLANVRTLANSILTVAKALR